MAANLISAPELVAIFSNRRARAITLDDGPPTPGESRRQSGHQYPGPPPSQVSSVTPAAPTDGDGETDERRRDDRRETIDERR